MTRVRASCKALRGESCAVVGSLPHHPRAMARSSRGTPADPLVNHTATSNQRKYTHQETTDALALRTRWCPNVPIRPAVDRAVEQDNENGTALYVLSQVEITRPVCQVRDDAGMGGLNQECHIVSCSDPSRAGSDVRCMRRRWQRRWRSHSIEHELDERHYGLMIT